MPSTLSYLFSLHGPVSRRSYLSWGLGLMGLKYLLDSSVVKVATGRWLSLEEFVTPLMSGRDALTGAGGGSLPLLLGALALPFLWVGMVLSLRRSEDAGLSAGVAFLFVVPLLNWALMLVLALAPSDPSPRPPNLPAASESITRSALLGVAAGTCITVSMVLLSTVILGEYGSTLFFATPFVMGATTAYIVNRGARQSITGTLLVSSASLVMAASAVLLFALEGMFCIVMAAPLALVAASLGALVGRHLALLRGSATACFMPALFALPLAAGAGSLGPHHDNLREVRTEVWIDAPPEVVWSYVVSFPALPEPDEWLFRSGFAYPTRAVIEEPRGVGAVRRCEFSTGAFVEPITVYDPPSRLAFDVTEQPAPLAELSPYGALDLPHLEGGMRSRRGEFRLTPAPGGGTHLSGSTWYTLGLEPSRYWAVWTDWVVHAVHERVLNHVRRCAEEGCVPSASP